MRIAIFKVFLFKIAIFSNKICLAIGIGNINNKTADEQITTQLATESCNNFIESKNISNNQKEPEFVIGEVIVKFKNFYELTDLSINNLKIKSLRNSVVNLIDSGRILPGGQRVFKLNLGDILLQNTEKNALKRATLEAVDRLNKLPEVEYAETNDILHAFLLPNDACYQQNIQWSMRNQEDIPGGINMPKAWDSWINGGQNVIVAVVDTGIVKKHSDIDISRLMPGMNFVRAETGADDGNGRPGAIDSGIGTDFHGTHVASVIGAVITNNNHGMAGINPSVRILPLKVLGDQGKGNIEDISSALRYATSQVKVINLSLGGFGQCKKTLQDAINKAFKEDVLIVVAAGNEAQDAKDYQPANCNNVLTVAASGPTGELADHYSNYGQIVDILAPGGDKRQPGGGIIGAIDNDNFAVYQGTSMAAPHVAGVAAFIKSKHPHLNSSEIETKIKEKAIPRTKLQCSNKPCGVGLLNADIP
ncbi:MAG: hypothetical protein BVN35_20555 [Proteobacteria bacterium ST_bin11]|nr:MAG: hypothetical protein BVN35_20555 [Proteobacteria bacterium ST_bin11]